MALGFGLGGDGFWGRATAAPIQTLRSLQLCKLLRKHSEKCFTTRCQAGTLSSIATTKLNTRTNEKNNMNDDLWNAKPINVNAEIGEQLRLLEQRVNKLGMVNQALWEIVSKDQGYDNDKLLAKLAEIDLRDGQLDGRIVGSHPVP